jgi:hypothetical protein
MLTLTKVLPALISSGSFTGSFRGTSSYSRRALTASYALNASGGGGASLRTGSTYPITASYSRKAVTASYLATISQSLIPAKNNTYSLGNATNKWKDIYVSTASIYFDNYPLTVTVTNNSPKLNFFSSSIVTVPIGSNTNTSSYALKALSASYVTGGGVGSSGTSGNNGSSGTSGTSGNNGSSGTSGNSGSSGTSGNNGSSGSSGASGTSGSSGANGTSGSSGTAGSSGSTGTSGSSGQNGSSGSSGSSGASGTSGNSGTSGSSGNNGTSGSSGAAGSSGSSGATGASGSSGTSGGGASLITGSLYPITSSWSRRSLTASYALNGGSGGGSTLRTGSTYPITSSFSRRAITASYALNGGTALVNQTMKYVSGSNLYVLSRSIVSPSDVLLSVNGIIQTPITDYTVSASSVTFTESYPSGSKINARYLVAATNSSDVNLANIVLTGTTTGDAYYPQVAALLHFDGTNGSTTITDNSKNNYSFTATNGAAISTAQSKFGGTSVFLDGTNDYIINNNANSTWTFLHNNTTFTLELWFYTSVTTAQTLISTDAASANIGFTLELSGINSRDIGFYTYRGVGGSILSATSVGSVWSTNTWNHLAVVLNTSTQTVKIYLNGTEVATTSTSGFSFSSSDPSYALAIGRYQVSSPAGYYSGYIDELRITNGYARYTGNFTPSTTAFSNTGGDVGKALVVNSTATGVSIGTAGYFSSQLAKAWVNFNGTGTVAIRDSYNVSSITDNATGQYYVNFSTPMNNTNYAVFGLAANSISSFAADHGGGPDTVNRCFFSVYNGAFADNSITQVIVFSN